mgnify:CR=1 FL=1
MDEEVEIVGGRYVMRNEEGVFGPEGPSPATTTFFLLPQANSSYASLEMTSRGYRNI